MMDTPSKNAAEKAAAAVLMLGELRVRVDALVSDLITNETSLSTALARLIASVGADEASGLVSPQTIRLADEGRLLLSRLCAPPGN